MHTTQPEKCAHPNCHCVVSEVQQYCSEYCREGGSDADHCECGHLSCRQATEHEADVAAHPPHPARKP